MKRIPIGISDYQRLVHDKFYIIDKSLMIKDYLDNQYLVTLVNRPRRFGKTLNMSMMNEFFDITKDSKKLFVGTEIEQTEYISEINHWPTIFISFAGAKESKLQIVKYIKLVLRNEYDRYAFIFKSMTVFEQNNYELIIKGLMNINDSELNNIDNSLAFLMQMLEKYYHKKVMLFIDEYDTPFIEAHVNGYYLEIKGGLSSLLHNALKLSSSLQCAFITGIQRVAKENIFSDLNNLLVCSVKDNEYDKYFGFTKGETKQFLEYYGLALNKDVKRMYDGYHIGNQEIYNPWSIVNFASRKKLEPYWINTSANTMIKKAMSQCDQSFKDGYEMLVKQGYLDTQLLMDTSYYEQSQTQSLWGLFINAGYLTIDYLIEDDFYRIRVPNQEVQKEFKLLTAAYLHVSSLDLENLYYALRTANEKMFNNSYKTLVMTLPSSHDLKNENSYHMMVLGLCAGLRNNYEINSNREAGKGRCDIILKAKVNYTSYVIEFKYLKQEKNKDTDFNKLNELANQAIEQINHRQYDYQLSNRVIYIGLAHCNKDVVVKWIEKT